MESEQGGENTLMVDGQSLEAAQFESDLGYLMSYPPELVTVNSWAGEKPLRSPRRRGPIWR